MSLRVPTDRVRVCFVCLGAKRHSNRRRNVSRVASFHNFVATLCLRALVRRESLALIARRFVTALLSIRRPNG